MLVGLLTNNTKRYVERIFWSIARRRSARVLAAAAASEQESFTQEAEETAWGVVPEDQEEVSPVSPVISFPPSSARPPQPGDPYYEDALKLVNYCFPIDSDARYLTRMPDAIRAFKAFAAQCPDFRCDYEALVRVWKYNQTHKTGKLLCRTMKQFRIACESPEENNLIQQAQDDGKDGPCPTCDKRVWEEHRAECGDEQKCDCGHCSRHAARHESGFSVAGRKGVSERYSSSARH